MLHMLTRTPTRHIKRFEKERARPSTKRFLVCYNGGVQGATALRAACEMADAHTRITAVYLDVLDPSSVCGDQDHPMRASAILAGALTNARLCGIAIDVQVIPCRVRGPALVAFLNEVGEATVFLGVERAELEAHSNPFVEFVCNCVANQVVLVDDALGGVSDPQGPFD